MLAAPLARWVPFALALTAAAACGGPEPAAPPAAESAGPPGRIVGTATRRAGDAPAPDIDMSADPVCASLHDPPATQREVLVDDQGRLENVLVHIARGLQGGAWAPPAEPRVLDQVGCLFVPRVQGLRAGQRLLVRNSDPTLHNVTSHLVNNPEFNIGQPFQGMEAELVFANPEDVFRLRCDTHPWMAAYLAVFDHPFYAVTAAGGGFALDDVPPGDYTVRAWHERLGVRELAVRVEAGATATLEFAFAAAD